MQMEAPPTNTEREALERVLASAEFSRSERLSSFLRYVCTATLDREVTRLTEQHIGTHVFGRPAHYLPAEDTIVRTTAGLLRKRLAKYYEFAGSADPLRIAIPRGSYVPVFVSNIAPPPPDDETAPATQGAIAESVAQQAVAPAPSTVSGWLGQWAGLTSASRKVAILTGILVVTVCAALVSAAVTHDPVDTFWKTVLAAQHETILVPADSELVMYQAATRRAVGLDDYLAKRFSAIDETAHGDGTVTPQFRWRRYTASISVTLAAELGRLSASSPQRLRVRYARDLQLNDLKHANAVLVGIEQANPWVHLFRERLNYHIDWDAPSDTLVVRNDHPAAGEQPRYAFSRSEGTRQGFATIAFTRNLSGDGHVLMVGGTSAAGTEAAVEFLLNREHMRAVLQRAVQADGSIGQFEVMLQCILQASGSTDVKLVGMRLTET